MNKLGTRWAQEFDPMTTMVFNLSVPQELLCGVLADCESEARKEATQIFIDELGDEEAFLLAQANGVSSVVAHVLVDAFGEDNVPDHWRNAHDENYRRISSYMAELDRLGELFGDAGISIVALKNGGIARGIFSCPACCPMGDLDVLVEKRHFRRAHQILLREGYQFEFRSPLEEAEIKAAEKNGGAEYWKILPNGEKLWLELQWRPVAGRWIRPDQEPSAEEFVARSVPIRGTAVSLLSPDDNLLQVALHTAKHSYVRAPGFRLHLDVDRIVRRQTIIDWDVFIKRVLALEVKTAVYFSLAIPKTLFHTPIPDKVLACLKPPVWKERLIIQWLHMVGVFNPEEKKFSRVGYIIFNALLYDDLRGLWRGLFPNKHWMLERYGIKNEKRLPFFYLKRLMCLMLRHINT